MEKEQIAEESLNNKGQVFDEGDISSWRYIQCKVRLKHFVSRSENKKPITITSVRRIALQITIHIFVIHRLSKRLTAALEIQLSKTILQFKKLILYSY